MRRKGKRRNPDKEEAFRPEPTGGRYGSAITIPSRKTDNQPITRVESKIAICKSPLLRPRGFILPFLGNWGHKEFLLRDVTQVHCLSLTFRYTPPSIFCSTCGALLT